MSIPEHKRYFWCIIAILLGIASVIPMPANAQALEVKVQDQDGKAIPEAEVQIGFQVEITNESGVAMFNDVSDTESLTVSARGFLDEEIINITDRININDGQREVSVVLRSSVQTVVTFGYVFFQIVVLLVVLAILGKNKSWSAHTNTAASILTIVGVLGTFIGIFIGLQEFSTDNLQNSIKDLLDGLKLAFGTSIVGIASALLLKGVISPLVQTLQKRNDQDPIEEVIEKFIFALKEVETSGESNLSLKLDELTKATKNEERDTGTVLGGINDIKIALTAETERTIPTQLHAIEKSLCDEEGNVVTELRSLRKEYSTQQDDLRKEFQQFSKNVAESVAKLATDELIEALKTVIQEFNSKIQEQFGENFKQLNEAVGKTVEWQEQYRQQMDKLAEEFRIAAKSIDDSRDSLKNIADSSSTIADKSGSIVASATKLDPILHTLNDQLGAFSDLRQKANDAFPLIEKRLEDLTTGFSDTVETTIGDSQKSMEKQRGELKTQTDLLENAVKDTAKKLENIVERNREDMENHVQLLHTELRKELTESLTQLAGYLDSLSTGFVDNYNNLTQSYTRAMAQVEQLLKAHQREP